MYSPDYTEDTKSHLSLCICINFESFFDRGFYLKHRKPRGSIARFYIWLERKSLLLAAADALCESAVVLPSEIILSRLSSGQQFRRVSYTLVLTWQIHDKYSPWLTNIGNCKSISFVGRICPRLNVKCEVRTCLAPVSS